MKRRNDSPDDGSGPSGETLPQKVLALLANTLAVGMPMTELYALVCSYAVINKRASSAPRPLIEALIRGSSRNQLKTIRPGLLKFFVAEGDYQNAAKYLPKGGHEDVGEYYAVMLCSLNDGDSRTARRLYVACMEYYPERDYGKRLEDDCFVVFELAPAVAAYHARTGNRSDAIKFWGMASESNPRLAEMRSNMVSARLVDTLLTTRNSLDALLAKQATPPAPKKTRAAQESSWQLENAIERLRLIEAELVHLLSPAQLRVFNIEPDLKDQDALGEEDR